MIKIFYKDNLDDKILQGYLIYILNITLEGKKFNRRIYSNQG